GEVEVDRRPGPPEPKLLLDLRVPRRLRVGLGVADVEIRRRGRDRKREERRLRLRDRPVRWGAAAQAGPCQVVLQPQRVVALAGSESEQWRVLPREAACPRRG